MKNSKEQHMESNHIAATITLRSPERVTAMKRRARDEDEGGELSPENQTKIARRSVSPEPEPERPLPTLIRFEEPGHSQKRGVSRQNCTIKTNPWLCPSRGEFLFSYT